jgi:hypothetical protein
MIPSFIYRDFNREGVDAQHSRPVRGSIGGMDVEIISSRAFCICIDGLHHNQGNHVFALDEGQAVLHVTLDPDVDLYDAIRTVLDRITADHQYMLRGRPFRDYIICSDALVHAHPELCHAHDDDERSHMDGPWMPFNCDTLAYVEHSQYDHDHTCETAIHGKVVLGPEGLVFTYDSPIIGRDSCPRYYKLTRGKLVWEITYQDVYSPEDA